MAIRAVEGQPMARGGVATGRGFAFADLFLFSGEQRFAGDRAEQLGSSRPERIHLE
jgi:hypothetical protein